MNWSSTDKDYCSRCRMCFLLEKWMKKVILIAILVCVSIGMYARQTKKNVNIVYIGNSITQGVLLEKSAEEAPPVQASLWLSKQPEMDTVNYSNQGVSGMTTVDFLPVSATLFLRVKSAANRFKDAPQSTLLFSVMLGTNDSAIKGPNGAPVSPKQYHANMKIIVDELLALYPHCKVVLHRPVWYSPNTHNGAIYLLEGLQRLENYLPELKALVGQYANTHREQVFMGDTLAFDYFKQNYQTILIPENGNAGTFYLHPNREGAIRLGEYWGAAIYQAIKE